MTLHQLTGLLIKVSPSSMRMIVFEFIAFSRSLNGRTRTATFTLVISLLLVVDVVVVGIQCLGFLVYCVRCSSKILMNG